ncbi:MAG: hypothetical protein P4M13_00930 [Alphaproteobacteria bacterium]|nr:hypothetical protein [Alphaproteobacteria bacterium]
MSRFFLILCLTLLLAPPAHADQPEAREVARLNNCSPKKIEVSQNLLGSEGETVYLVTCDLPKTVSADKASGPDAVLIGCEESLCELIRPVSTDKK